MRRKIESLSTTFLSFLRSEASVGVILLICAILAVIIANSPWGGAYEHSFHTPIAIGIGPFSLEMGLLPGVNDRYGVFFILSGRPLEVRIPLWRTPHRICHDSSRLRGPGRHAGTGPILQPSEFWLLKPRQLGCCIRYCFCPRHYDLSSRSAPPGLRLSLP